jgi:uncharacterized protein (TIGR01777 family)
MKVALTGSGGLVGSHLIHELQSAGHKLTIVVRSDPKSIPNAIHWNPEMGEIDSKKLEGIDAVIHLAGENIASRRWTAKQKKKIRHSRVNGTRLLSETIAHLTDKPDVFVSASAIGFYGDRGQESLSEESQPGQGFLAEVCKDWEGATQPAIDAGIRTVHLRIGVILSPEGGALVKMLTPFRMGLGGKLGSGSQQMSWIALDDVIGSILHVLENKQISGPVNLVSPNPVSNHAFTKTLGRVLRRPTIFPVPSFMARLAFGEMADELLLASTKVQPKRLQESGYIFRHPDLDDGLRHLLLT